MRTSESRVRAIALTALLGVLIAFVLLYVDGRLSERGTSRDDSTAAELGVDR